jgi:cytochrome P450 PksS
MAAGVLHALPITDLSEPIMFSNPFPRYAELRRDAPVSMVKHRETRNQTSYMLTRYEDLVKLHIDPRFSNDQIKGTRAEPIMRRMPRMFRLLTDSMVFKDDPDHNRLRGLVSKAFTPKMVQQMADDVQRIVDERIDALAAKGRVDIVDDLAVPVPLAVISAMLGIDDASRAEFEGTLHHFANATGGALGFVRQLPNLHRMVKMIDRLVERRRADPDGGMVTALVQANESGDVLSDDEIVSMIFLLLFAGYDTTSNLIGSSVLALLDHPDQLARLRAEPTLIDSAVEEMLRFTTPVPCGVTRKLTDDIEIAGTVIPKGSSVLGMIISANHDETVFEHPETLDLGRTPNKHLSFAFGGHFCLGNQIARMEGRMALQSLVQRFDHIELLVPRDELEWKPTQSLRGLRHLPVALS